MALRLRGQETEIRISAGGVLQDTITKISNFEFTVNLEMTEEGFLGATTNEMDEIYNGCSFKFDLQLDSGDWFSLQDKIVSKARRITPDLQFTIASVLNFPSGETKAIIIPDAHFGGQPMSIGGRKEYVKVSCEGGASNYDRQDL